MNYPAFMDDLQAGGEHAVLVRVWLERTLDLVIREDYHSISAGGSLL